MGKLYKIWEDYEERGGYGQRGDHDEVLEKAFKEGCEHGYKKAMKEMESYHERGGMGRVNYKEGFEEKIERLKLKYK